MLSCLLLCREVLGKGVAKMLPERLIAHVLCCTHQHFSRESPSSQNARASGIRQELLLVGEIQQSQELDFLLFRIKRKNILGFG